MKTFSLPYRLLRFFKINLSEAEYGKITINQALIRALRGLLNAIILKYCMYSVLLAPLNYRLIRPFFWRLMGVKVGRNCFIGYEVWIDLTNAELIEIGDNVHITNRCLFLCHQRDLGEYRIGDDSSKLPYKRRKITLENGCMVGMGTIIMPGVTIGEGAIVGSGSLVTCDIPGWSVAVGRPARVVKNILPRE